MNDKDKDLHNHEPVDNEDPFADYNVDDTTTTNKDDENFVASANKDEIKSDSYSSGQHDPIPTINEGGTTWFTWLQDNKLYLIAVVVAAFVILWVFTSNEDKTNNAFVTKRSTIVSTPIIAKTTTDPSSTVKNTPIKNESVVIPKKITKVNEEPKLAEHVNIIKKAPIVSNNSTEKYTEKEIKQINQKLFTVEQTVSSYNALQQELDKVKNDLISAEQLAITQKQRIENLEKTLTNLTTVVQEIQKTTYRAELYAQSQRDNEHDKLQKATYVVQAAIPGRAWLRNNDGVLITVQPGQQIPGFGTVQKIDPAKGIVTMSTQVVFSELE